MPITDNSKYYLHVCCNKGCSLSFTPNSRLVLQIPLRLGQEKHSYYNSVEGSSKVFSQQLHVVSMGNCSSLAHATLATLIAAKI